MFLVTRGFVLRGLHLPVGGCLVTALALAAVWPADVGAADAEVRGHVTTFNNDQIFTTPDIPLEDYGFAVHSYLSADLATRPGEMAADIRRSGLFYFGQQCDPAVVLRRPGAVEALHDLLRSGGTIVFDYCGVERPETVAFLEAVGVAVPGGYAPGWSDVQPSSLPAEAGHPLLSHPFELDSSPIPRACFGHWATWSENQVAPFRATADDRAAVLVQAGVEGRGTVVFSRMLSMFRRDYGRRGEPVKNLLSFVFGLPVREKTVMPVHRRFVGTERLTVWHKPRYAPFPAEADAASNRQLSAITVQAAVNEQISTAFLLTASAAGPLEVGVDVNDLDGPVRLAAERILIRELRVFHDYTDRWLPDPMPEVRSLSIPAGETRQVWLTINTAGLTAGTYSGGVQITATGLEPRVLPFTIEVLPIELPTENPLRLCTWDYVPSIGRDELVGGVQNWKHYHRDLVEHGTNVFPIMSFNHPRPVVDDEGNLKQPLDFTRFDAEFFTRDPGQIYLIYTPRVFGDLVSQLGAGSPAYERMLRAWLRAVVRHLRKDLGLSSDQFAFYPFDELHRDEDIPLAKREYEIIEEVDPEAKIFLTLGYPSIIKFDRVKVVAPHIDIWSVVIDFHRHWKGFRRQQREAIFECCRAHGGEVWSYEDIDRKDEWSAYRFGRLKPWGAMRLGLGGYGFWAYNIWKGDPWEVFDATGEPKSQAGTERLSAIYSGPTPVSSVRWEALREGMNDIKYLAVLRREIEAAQAAGRGADPCVQTAERLAEEAVQTVTEADSSPELADTYRRRVAEMILELRSPR